MRNIWKNKYTMMVHFFYWPTVHNAVKTPCFIVGVCQFNVWCVTLVSVVLSCPVCVPHIQLQNDMVMGKV